MTCLHLNEYEEFSHSSGLTLFTYDNAGNPLTYRGMNMTWQNGRQLAGFSGSTHDGIYWGDVTMEYDHNGLRTKKSRRGGINNNDQYFYWEGNRLIAEQHGALLLWFYYDESGVSGMWVEGMGEYIFEKNILGDVVGIWDTYGTRIGGYTYDAWGNTTLTNYTGGIIANLNPFRYRGYYQDQETGFYYLQSRYYDPTTGRFINADNPLNLFAESVMPSGANLYQYCYNNPVMYLDSTGESATAAMALWFVGSLIVMGALQLFGPSGSAQVAGGGASMANGGYAVYTGASLTARGLWYFGIPLMLIGGATALWGVNETVNGATGTNYFQQWTGISDWGYYGIGMWSNIGSATGNALGQQYLRTHAPTASLNQTHGRTMSNRQYAALKGDIATNGIRNPLAVTRYNGSSYVVNGNHRLMIARQLGIRNVPVCYVGLPYLGYLTPMYLFM